MSGRPDLCVMGYDLRASGVVRNALRIAGAAAAAGLRTELWVMRNDGPMRADLPPGVTLRAAPDPGRDRGRGFGLLTGIPSLARHLAVSRPRIALSSGNHLHVAAALAWRWAGRPRDVRLWARASNATLKHPLGAWLGRDLAGFAGAAIDRLNRLQYADFDRIIAVCRELGGNLAEELAIPGDRVTVIPNGVDVAGIAERAQAPLDHPWMTPGAPPVILSAGRLSRQKNFADLVRALPLVRRQVPARLVILGSGPDAQRHRLTRLARRLGVADAVLCHGFDGNPFRWMARAAVLAVSSRWEGSSNVVLEALACGTPVVAYRCPTGIAEVLEPLGGGHVVPPGDVAGLAAALVRQISSPADAARLVAHARQFDLARTLDAYVALFRRELGR
jgi:glycosyltransferase involved in cell wall biosynthesis